jgi:hypothetical protein
MAVENVSSPPPHIPTFGQNLYDLKLPEGGEFLLGADTGTYMAALLAWIEPGDSGNVFILAEVPNYHYVGGEIELIGMSTPEWASTVVETYRHFHNTTKVHGWVDPNSQFRRELLHYDLVLHANHRGLELRVEIAREYMQAGKVFMAPWLDVLPYELENARWPDQETVGGKFVREKRNDHVLDGFEHILSRRPRSRQIARERSQSFLDKMLQQHRRPQLKTYDPHMGGL